MNHPILEIKAFEIIGAYTLHILFDDHKEQIIDFEPVLAGELFGTLRDRSLFEQVKIDPRCVH